MRRIAVRSTGRMPGETWEGGIPYLSIQRTGYRSGKTLNANGEPVGNILVGCIYIPTRRIVGHTRSDAEGNYYFDGLRENVSDYFFFAYPDEERLGGVFDFATRYRIE